jgi:hypothetical protein
MATMSWRALCSLYRRKDYVLLTVSGERKTEYGDEIHNDATEGSPATVITSSGNTLAGNQH